jgi:flagellar FliJ protein
MKRAARLDQLRTELDNQQKGMRQKLAATERRAQEAADRLAELRQYRDEYANGFAARASAGIGGAGLRDYQAFLLRLEDAVRQQQHLTARAEAELDFERQRWREAAIQVKAVESVGARWRSEEQVMADRAEQRETDERATDIARRRTGEFS